MDRVTFNKFREIVYNKSGIALGEGKEALVCSRVAKRMRFLGINDHRSYLRYVIQDITGEEVVKLLDAISTNVTSFFREPSHFEILSKIASQWLSAGQRRLRIWSAACSTGEEPYSIAITLLETIKRIPVDLKILATDISTRVLEKCQEGCYDKDKVKTVPMILREKYFEQHNNSHDTYYFVKSFLKNLILFRRLNLSNPPFPIKGHIDVIFCRNVMIYFDNSVRKRLLAELYHLLKPGGYLIVGHAESLTGMVSDFRSIGPSIYAK